MKMVRKDGERWERRKDGDWMSSRFAVWRANLCSEIEDVLGEAFTLFHIRWKVGLFYARAAWCNSQLSPTKFRFSNSEIELSCSTCVVRWLAMRLRSNASLNLRCGLFSFHSRWKVEVKDSFDSSIHVSIKNLFFFFYGTFMLSNSSEYLIVSDLNLNIQDLGSLVRVV